MIGLKTIELTKRFVSPGGNVITALDHVTLEIASSEFVIIVGHNGSGKTTLLNILTGQHSPDEGSITAIESGTILNWSRLSASERGRYVAVVHQDPRIGTVNDLTVLENLRLATFDGVPSPLRRSLPNTA